MKTHVKLSTLGNASTPDGEDVQPAWFWRLVIPTTMPLMSLALLIFLLYADITSAYEGYPDWMQAIGWTLLVINLTIVPVGGLWQWRRHGASALPPVEEDELRLKAALGACAEKKAIPASTRRLQLAPPPAEPAPACRGGAGEPQEDPARHATGSVGEPQEAHRQAALAGSTGAHNLGALADL